MKNCLTRWVQRKMIPASLVIGLCAFTGRAQAAWDVDFQWYPNADPSAVGTCIAGQPATFTASITGSPPSGLVQYLWTFRGCTAAGTCPQGADAHTVTWTYPKPLSPNSVQLEVRITPSGAQNYESRSCLRSVPVTASTFTVNIVPSAGCTVTAGDGGVDDAEPNGNGIVCYSETTDDALCTEQYANSQIASLKVVPESGYAFTGWTVNDAQVQTAAEPLFLTTMPVLAANGDWLTPLTGNTANCQANCSGVTMTAPDTVKRDEIFDVTLTLNPPPLWGGTTVTFDIDGQKTQNLPERGEVQMYDFGYDTDADGDIESGQTTYAFNPLIDGGTKTIKVVYNLYHPPQTIKILASVGGQTFESQPIAVTYQIRKYTTAQGYIHTNDFDNNIVTWVDYWDDWNYPDPPASPYTFKMNGSDIEDKLTYDLAKAICFKESSMKEVDLMQVTDVAKERLNGEIDEHDWNWSAPPDSDGDYPSGDLVSQPFMHYTGVADDTEDASLQWGIRWLYAKKSRGIPGSKSDTLRPAWDN